MRRCLDCGKDEGFCIHPSFSSILGQVSQSGHYLWWVINFLTAPKALVVLIQNGYLIYTGQLHPGVHRYILSRTRSLDDATDFTKFMELTYEFPHR